MKQTILILTHIGLERGEAAARYLLSLDAALEIDIYEKYPECGNIRKYDHVVRLEAHETESELRKRLFDFYLKELLGKEILGEDSCGACCDL